ncbi:chitinase [Virgibacillus soli]|uniref:glycoside hydrolase family 18 protein n=1 Tax=Lederbergia galactosidilytica TaxID=217031 RepID=UPI00071599FD|nr:glycoside hydrolase family 18 protein [Lederbergia galactosidilytica]KRG15052.1 chitinase [Virgibacillus soli]MBP1913343.1 chitinase [Lederbergia galactosidilytica]
MQLRELSGKKKGSIVLISSFLLVLSLFFPSFFLQSLNVVKANEGNIVLGYYTSWNPPQNLDASKLTHINYAFADVCWDGIHGNPNNEEIAEGEPKTWTCKDLQGNEAKELENGTIVLYDPEVDLVELSKLAALKNQNKNLKTLISVGGWTLSNNLSLVTRTEETRETFAQSAVDFVREFDLDGLDLDWEYPVAAGMETNHRDPSDKQNHTLLLQAVRDAFTEAGKEDGKEYLVTIAGAATWAYAENNELGKIAEVVDYIAIMAYDINGTWSGVTGHNAPLHADPLEAEIRGWNFGVDSTMNVYGAVPKHKLLLGLPFYGHSWAGCNTEDNGKMVMEKGPYQQCAAGWEAPGIDGGTVNYNIVKSLINQDGYNYFFDNVSKVPYLYNEKKGEFISYDNVESLGYKVNFIKDQGLAGAMVWDLAGDDADYNLLKTVSHGLGVSNDAPAPDPMPEVEIGISDGLAPVSAGSLIKILEAGKETGVQIQIPADLPEGTKLDVVKAQEGMDKLSGFKAAGPVYTFNFEYLEGEGFTSEEGFGLTFPVDPEAKNPAIYYFNSQKEEWEKVSEEVIDGKIMTTVAHFSTYGVFAEDEEVDQGNGNDETEDPQDGPNDDGKGKDDGTGSKDDGIDGDDQQQDGDGNGAKGNGTMNNGKNDDSDDDQNGSNGNNGINSTKGGDGTNHHNQPPSKNPKLGNVLPNTATNLFNLLMVGILASLSGIGIFLYQRRKQTIK